MKKPRVLALLAAALLCVACGGCTGGKNASQSAASGAASSQGDLFSKAEETPSPLASPQGEVTVVVNQGDIARLEALEEIGEKYKADRPGVELRFEVAASPEEVARRLAAGEGDILELEKSQVPALAKQGLLREFYDYWLQSFGRGTITGAAQQAMFSMGKETCYLLPNRFSQMLVYTDPTILDVPVAEEEPSGEEGEGVPVATSTPVPENQLLRPFSWSAMAKLGEELGGTTFAYAGEEDLLFYFDTFLWGGAGNTVADRSAAYFRKDKKEIATVFTSPNGEKALELMYQVFTTCAPKEAINWTSQQAAQAFGKGETAMLLARDTMMPAVEQARRDAPFVAGMFLRGLSGACIMEGDYAGWGVNAASKNSDTALDFLLFFCNLDNSTHLAKVTEEAPLYRESLDMEPAIEKSKVAPLTEMIRNSDLHSFMGPPVMYEGLDTFQEIAPAKIRAFLQDEITAQELLAFADDYWMKLYEEQGRLWTTEEIEQKGK